MSWRQKARAAVRPRQQPATLPEYEEALRAAFGFTRREAETLAYGGWRALEALIAPGDGREALKRALKAA